MLTRRNALGLLASASSLALVASSDIGVAQKGQGKKHHQDGAALLGGKNKQNGKHKLHQGGKSEVSIDVANGKVVGLTAKHPNKGNLKVGKAKSTKKLAEGGSNVIRVADRGVEIAQADQYYYGYWFYDDVDYYYYWFPAEYVIVDTSWVLITF